MRFIAGFLFALSFSSARAEVVIQGKITGSDTGTYYNVSNPIITNGGNTLMGGVSFTTGVSGGNPSNSWRLNSVGFCFSVNKPSGWNTFSITNKSIFLYEVSGGTSLNYVGSTSNFTLVNSLGSEVTSITGSDVPNGNFSYVKANFGDWSALNGQVIENSKTYLLGLNLSGTMSKSDGILYMDLEKNAGQGFYTPADGWVIGPSYVNEADADPNPGNWKVETVFSDLGQTSTNIGFTLEATAVPEPSTILLYGLALTVAGIFAWRKHQKKFGKMLKTEAAG